MIMRQRKTTTVKFSIEDNKIDGVERDSVTMLLKPRETEALRKMKSSVLFESAGIAVWCLAYASAHHRRKLKRFWKKGYNVTTDLK